MKVHMSGGSDFLALDVTRAPSRGAAAWLAREVRDAVEDGRLRRGDRLPATRDLARDLDLSRGVVVAAYQRLIDEGLVEANAGAGTRVVGLGTVVVGGARRSEPARPDRLPVVPDRPALDLSPGTPDLSAFPRAAWLRTERAVLAEAGAADLGYGDPRGHAALRTVLAGWLARTRGVRVDPDGLVVVAGVAQALALLWRVLQSAGVTSVAVEDPGSRGAREQLLDWGMTPVPVPVDDHGARVDLVPPDVGVVMLTPAHQFPTGVVLAPERRRALLERAVASAGLVIEDDYDAEHRYDRAPVPALQASAPDHVAHTGSTSKTLAPGMRLGWLAPPPRLLRDVVAARHSFDLGSPALPQLVLARLIADGSYDAHLRRVRRRQRDRRDAVVAAVRDRLPGAEVTGVAAGLHVLVLLPEGVDDVLAAERAAAAGVLVQPLSWHRVAEGPGPTRPGLVIGYAAYPPDMLREAVRLVAAAVR